MPKVSLRRGTDLPPVPGSHHAAWPASSIMIEAMVRFPWPEGVIRSLTVQPPRQQLSSPSSRSVWPHRDRSPVVFNDTYGRFRLGRSHERLSVCSRRALRKSPPVLIPRFGATHQLRRHSSHAVSSAGCSPRNKTLPPLRSCETRLLARKGSHRGRSRKVGAQKGDPRLCRSCSRR